MGPQLVFVASLWIWLKEACEDEFIDFIEENLHLLEESLSLFRVSGLAQTLFERFDSPSELLKCPDFEHGQY